MTRADKTIIRRDVEAWAAQFEAVTGEDAAVVEAPVGLVKRVRGAVKPLGLRVRVRR